jgi:hypothetical protein
MVMKRVEGWPLKLSRFLRARRDMPFAWGSNDCLMFAADAVKEITGIDLALRWRGTYSTEEEAATILAGYGGVSGLISLALGHNGTRNVMTAKRGDVAMIKTDQGEMAAIVDDSGARIAVPMSDKMTIVRFPLEKAWRVWGY